jgi:hypothetical protein
MSRRGEPLISTRRDGLLAFPTGERLLRCLQILVWFATGFAVPESALMIRQSIAGYALTAQDWRFLLMMTLARRLN